ncbi:hypothetical protein HN011_005094 [Eciton burchellii]|nr:hypothetical protein HN011_005094 [Eciton burchellii]
MTARTQQQIRSPADTSQQIAIDCLCIETIFRRKSSVIRRHLYCLTSIVNLDVDPFSLCVYISRAAKEHHLAKYAVVERRTTANLTESLGFLLSLGLVFHADNTRILATDIDRQQ